MVAKKIAVIGAGNMGTALLRGILGSGWGTKENLIASHPKRAKGEALASELGIAVTEKNDEAARQAQIVILAVKPQILESVLDEIRPARRRDALLISIAAGFPTSRIESALGGSVPVVRAMPNVAAVVRSSATVLCAGRHAGAEHLADARRIFESIGLVVELPEYQLDAVTGLSGSGPMYVFQIIEGLSDAGVRVGLSRDVSTALTIQTLVGRGEDGRGAENPSRHSQRLRHVAGRNRDRRAAQPGEKPPARDPDGRRRSRHRALEGAGPGRRRGLPPCPRKPARKR